MMEHFFTFGIVFLSVVLFFIYKSRGSPGKSPPGSKGYPILGNLFDVNVDTLYLKLFEWSKEYGEIFEFNLCGRKMVSLNSSEIIRELFTKEPHSTVLSARPPSFVGRYCSDYTDVFMASTSPKQYRRRKYLHQVMHVYGDGLKYLEKHITELFTDLSKDIDQHRGEVCNPVKLIDRFVMSTLQILLIGKILLRREEFHQYLKDMADSLNTLLNPGVNTLYSIFPFLRHTSLPGGKAFKQFEERKAGFLKLLESLTGDEDEHQGIYQQMKKDVRSGQQEEWLSERIMIEMLTINVIGATFLTTRNTLTALTRILQSRPEIQRKIQDEVDSVIGPDRKPTVNDRYDMPYTEAVIQETLRFISNVPLSGLHATAEDTTIRGYHIPKGATVIQNLWTCHHNDKEWKDPFAFNPDRYFDEQGHLVPADHPIRKQLLPFGIGKRACIGEVFGKTRIFLYLSTMMQLFSVEPEDGVIPPMLNLYEMTPGIVLESPPFKCRFVRRH